MAAYDVLQPVFLEGAILVPDHLELPVYLPQQKPTFDDLKREVIEPKHPEVAPNKKWVLIWL